MELPLVCARATGLKRNSFRPRCAGRGRRRQETPLFQQICLVQASSTPWARFGQAGEDTVAQLSLRDVWPQSHQHLGDTAGDTGLLWRIQDSLWEFSSRCNSLLSTAELAARDLFNATPQINIPCPGLGKGWERQQILQGPLFMDSPSLEMSQDRWDRPGINLG